MKSGWTYFRGFLLGMLLALSFLTSQATHFAGGELSYRCLDAQGNFEFTAIIYRDCNPDAVAFNLQQLTLTGPHGLAYLPLVGMIDVSPRCASPTAMLRCEPLTSGNSLGGSMAKFIFKGSVNLSQLQAPSPNTPHVFKVTLPCCRTVDLINSVASGQPMVLQVSMFRYFDAVRRRALKPSELCDNAPVAMREQQRFQFVNPFDTLWLQTAAADPDLADSVAYAIGAPRNTNGPVAYHGPYSLENPLPGLLGPAFVGAQNHPIHPRTGEMVLRPNTLGNFVTVVVVKSYRNQQLIAAVEREFSLRISPYPPDFQGLPAEVDFRQQAPQIFAPYNASAGYINWEPTYYVGDTIDLTLQAADWYPVFTGFPHLPATWQVVFNQMRMAVSASMLPVQTLNAGFCDLPPCASLRNWGDVAPPAAPTMPLSMVQYGNGQALGVGESGSVALASRLYWVPACNQVVVPGDTAWKVYGRDYPVMVTALDNHCVAEGRSDKVVVLRILNRPTLPPAQLLSLRLDSVRMQYELRIQQPIDSLSYDLLDSIQHPQETAQQWLLRSKNRRLASFQAVRLYRSSNGFAPWTLVGESRDALDSILRDTTTYSGYHSFYYQVRTVSGCEAQEVAGNSLFTEFIPLGVSEQQLSGVAIKLYPNPGRDLYTLEAMAGNLLPSHWQLFDAQGREVLRMEVAAGEQRHTFDLSAFPAGFYQLRDNFGRHQRSLVHLPR